MRLSLRLIAPLAIALALLALLFLPFIDRWSHHYYLSEIDGKSRLLATSLQKSVGLLMQNPSEQKFIDFFSEATDGLTDEHLAGLAFCTPRKMYASKSFPPGIRCQNLNSSPTNYYVTSTPIQAGNKFVGNVIVAHDISFIDQRIRQLKWLAIGCYLAMTLLILSIFGITAGLLWQSFVRLLKGLLKGETVLRPISQLAHLTAPELKPLIRDLRHLLDMQRPRVHPLEPEWNSQALRDILRKELKGDEILVVSNREPYSHVKVDDHIEVQFPASGLVTALEPIMRACSGTWIAHGAGNADRDVVDQKDHVQVPPDRPSYQIRRIWLSEEEESGYYYGFANEGLWALCHIAHVRPVFRSDDWAQYVAVNQKFANAVVEEAKTDDPVILVQDYHFALLPKMIRRKLPNATIITFWHIPFPNPEVFSICPWREEILDGLLGSSILGFHTRFHCNNFIDTVDRFMESRIDRDVSTISYGGQLTAVKSYPISIEFPGKWLEQQKSVRDCRTRIRQQNDLPKDRLIGIGVDRLDYTKGILERFYAVERLLELNPKWIGKFTFIQIAAPSRSRIEQYRNFEFEVRELAERINERFGKPGYQPILLKIRHHNPLQVYEYYRASDLCFVSSLHDGMNLVAKEYVASRDDEQGVLILSQFTGASVELPEAVIVNPYNIDQCAAALNFALEMPKDEQRQRMRSMRNLIQEFNVYRWAGRILLDAAVLRKRQRLLGNFAGNFTGGPGNTQNGPPDVLKYSI